MRLLADMHISPRTVAHLRATGHDVVRVDALLPPTAADEDVLGRAISEKRVVLTQDLDFSRLVVASGRTQPSIISLWLTSSRIEHVNAVLDRVLPSLEHLFDEGAIVSIEDDRVRKRTLPVG